MKDSSLARRLRSAKPSPSMIVAMTALIVACGGTAIAATIITSSSQVKNGVLTGADIKNRSLTGSDLADGTISASKLRAGVRSAGGSGEAYEVVRPAGPVGVPPNGNMTMATLKGVPAGVWLVTAKTIMTSEKQAAGLLNELVQTDKTKTYLCKLFSPNGDTDDARGIIETVGGGGLDTAYMQMTVTTGAPGDFKLECGANGEWRAGNTSIIARRLTSAPRSTEGP